MFSKYIEVSILGFIQGFSEFIPVSSSAHLILVSKIYNFNISSLQLDISLHLGSLFAILFYYGFNSYIGSKFIYTLFGILALIMVLISFNKRKN